MPKQSRTLREPVTYILRIYRQGPEQVNGLFEDPKTGGRHVFTAANELWKLILATEDSQRTETASGAIAERKPKETKL